MTIICRKFWHLLTNKNKESRIFTIIEKHPPASIHLCNPVDFKRNKLMLSWNIIWNKCSSINFLQSNMKRNSCVTFYLCKMHPCRVQNLTFELTSIASAVHVTENNILYLKLDCSNNIVYIHALYSTIKLLV